MHFNRMDTTTCIIYNSSSPPPGSRLWIVFVLSSAQRTFKVRSLVLTH